MCAQTSFSKLEQLHTGDAYCQFMAVLFPGVVSLKKVKFNSRLEHEWLGNFKIFSTAFKDVRIDKVCDL